MALKIQALKTIFNLCNDHQKEVMLAVIVTESTISANLVVGLFPVVAFRYGYISKLSIKDRDLHNPNFCTKFGRPYFAIFLTPKTCSKSNPGRKTYSA